MYLFTTFIDKEEFKKLLLSNLKEESLYISIVYQKFISFLGPISPGFY